jgi:hypothetical protein
MWKYISEEWELRFAFMGTIAMLVESIMSHLLSLYILLELQYRQVYKEKKRTVVQRLSCLVSFRTTFTMSRAVMYQ